MIPSSSRAAIVIRRTLVLVPLTMTACGGSQSNEIGHGDASPGDASATAPPGDAANLEDAAAATLDGPADTALPSSDAQPMADGGTPGGQCPPPTAEAGAVPAASPPVCTPLAPTSSIIATFAGSSPVAFAPFGTASLVGGTFIYPTCSSAPPEPSNPLFEDFSANNWHITGSVGAFSGFGLFWALESGQMGGFPTYASGPIDVSAFAGIQFDIAGNPGPLGVISFDMQSTAQQALSVDPSQPNCGICDPAGGVCNVASTTNISNFTDTSQTVRIRWNSLTNTIGPGLDTTKVTSISWFFPWTQGATPYPVDVTLANIQFIQSSAVDASGE